MRAEHEPRGQDEADNVKETLDRTLRKALAKPTPGFRRESWRAFQEALDRRDVSRRGEEQR